MLRDRSDLLNNHQKTSPSHQLLPPAPGRSVHPSHSQRPPRPSLHKASEERRGPDKALVLGACSLPPEPRSGLRATSSRQPSCLLQCSPRSPWAARPCPAFPEHLLCAGLDTEREFSHASLTGGTKAPLSEPHLTAPPLWDSAQRVKAPLSTSSGPQLRAGPIQQPRAMDNGSLFPHLEDDARWDLGWKGNPINQWGCLLSVGSPSHEPRNCI